MQEEWKDVPGWEGKYQVSNKGRVRSFDRWANCGHGKQHLRKGKILQGVQKCGRYWAYTFSDNEKRQQYLVQYLVASAFIGPRPKGMHVLHNDDNLHNNCLDNIRYGTVADNNRDKVKNKRQPVGSKHHMAKLTEVQVKEARKMYLKGATQISIANKYGVSPSVMNYICLNKTWKHI